MAVISDKSTTIDADEKGMSVAKKTTTEADSMPSVNESSFLTSPSLSSSLAAKSAYNSLKRTRLLFDYKTNPIPDFQPQHINIPKKWAQDHKRLRKEQEQKQEDKGPIAYSENSYEDSVDGKELSLYKASYERRKRALLGGRAPSSNSTGQIKKMSQKLNNAIVVSSHGEEKDDGKEINTSNLDSLSLSLPPPSKDKHVSEMTKRNAKSVTGSTILVKSDKFGNQASIPTPKWHAPWKLSTVLSSHLGWVRSIAFDPTNTMFATGSADRTIKVWNFPKASVGASDALQLTLTGHIGPVRGMAFSNRHPYLFTCGEDKMIKCWDLETNQVIRHYHGHLSGIFCLSLHPTLDLLVTGGRDAVARIWDIRTKKQIHCLTGHDHTVASVLTKSTNPQIITGSHDTTVKLWDIVAGKCITTLTHHMKSIRTMAQPSFENTFLSGSTDCIKKWSGRDGKFIKSWYYDQNNNNARTNNTATTTGSSIVHSMSMNDDGVVVSANDNGNMNFWDYYTGYNFQSVQSQVQPGSLDAENAVLTSSFDLTGTRLITGEADKTIKIWKEDTDASELSFPIDTVNWRKKCLQYSKQRY